MRTLPQLIGYCTIWYKGSSELSFNVFSMYFSKYYHVGGFALLKVLYTDDGSHFSCLVNLRVFITPIIAVTCHVRHFKNKHLFVLSVV